MSEITEKLIIKGLLTDKKYLTAVSSVFEPEYFDDPIAKEVFEKIKDYHGQYLKSVDIGLLKTMDYKDEIEAKEFLESVNQLDYDVVKHYDYLFDQTNNHLKEAAMKNAIMNSVPLAKTGRFAEIEDLVKHALSKDLRIDLGLEYFKTIAERLYRMIEGTGKRIPFYYPTLDEFTNGGTHAFTLSVFLAQIHGFKCLSGDTNITIKENNIIKNISLKSLFDSKYIVSREVKEKDTMLGLEGMIKKYGEEEGTKKYQEWKLNVGKSSKNRNTKDSLIEKYGKEEGTKKHQEYLMKQKESHSLQGMIKKYGEEEGTKRWNDKLNFMSYKNTLEYSISIYGEEEGTKRWNERQIKWQKTMNGKDDIDEINKKKAITEKNLIKKYGEEEGTKKYQEWINKQKFAKTIEYYIEKYGKVNGEKLFYEKRQRWIDSLFISCSSISKEVFKEIEEVLSISLEKEKVITKYRVDAIFGNKIIEFYGDYWHCNPLLYEINYYHRGLCMTAEEKHEVDYQRLTRLKSYGFDVFIIWEYEWRNNKEECLKKLKDYLNV